MAAGPISSRAHDQLVQIVVVLRNAAGAALVVGESYERGLALPYARAVVPYDVTDHPAKLAAAIAWGRPPSGSHTTSRRQRP